MQTITQLTPLFSVCPQIDEADMSTLASLGYKTVINNRPDGESADQPSSAIIAEAAYRHGLVYCHLPISMPVNFDDVAAVTHSLDTLPSPVVAYCRSGTRSAILWALSQASKMDSDTILKQLDDVGYPLEALRHTLERLQTRDQ